MEMENIGLGIVLVRSSFLISKKTIVLPANRTKVTTVINPRGPAPPPHEDDLFMLGDVASALQLLPSSASGNNSPLPSSNVNVNVKMGERVKPKVSWLRNTEYLSSEAGAGRGVQNGSNGAM
jgi:hypothetical protein